jgi:hypothetical protein
MTINYTSSAANKRGIISTGKTIQYVEKAQPNKAVGCLIGLLSMVMLFGAIVLILAA